MIEGAKDKNGNWVFKVSDSLNYTVVRCWRTSGPELTRWRVFCNRKTGKAPKIRWSRKARGWAETFEKACARAKRLAERRTK